MQPKAFSNAVNRHEDHRQVKSGQILAEHKAIIELSLEALRVQSDLKQSV